MWRSPPDNNDTDSDEKAHGAETSDVEEGDVGRTTDTGSSSRSGSDSEM